MDSQRRAHSYLPENLLKVSKFTTYMGNKSWVLVYAKDKIYCILDKLVFEYWNSNSKNILKSYWFLCLLVRFPIGDETLPSVDFMLVMKPDLGLWLLDNNCDNKFIH